MDENQILDSDSQGAFSLPSQSIEFLKIAANWSGFLAILGFIGLGFLVLFGLFFGTIMGVLMTRFEEATPFPVSTGAFGFIYILMALVYFFPVLYLWKFSDKTKTALRSGNTTLLNEAFLNLGRHYKFVGIIAIVMIALFLVNIVTVIGMAASMG